MPAPVEKEIEKWEPSDNEMICAGNLVRELKTETGHNPTKIEMINYVGTKMNIPSSKAEIILDELGLLEIS